jgi:hypothetical protein
MLHDLNYDNGTSTERNRDAAGRVRIVAKSTRGREPAKVAARKSRNRDLRLRQVRFAA